MLSVHRSGPALPKHPPGKAVKAGAGFLSKKLPSDEKVAVDAAGKRAHPKVTADFVGVPRSNSWWSSLILAIRRQEPVLVEPVRAPRSPRAYKDGLALAYVDQPTFPQARVHVSFRRVIPGSA